MGDTVTKIGEARISPKWHISLISNARPFLQNPRTVRRQDFRQSPWQAPLFRKCHPTVRERTHALIQAWDSLIPEPYWRADTFHSNPVFDLFRNTRCTLPSDSFTNTANTDTPDEHYRKENEKRRYCKQNGIREFHFLDLLVVLLGGRVWSICKTKTEF